MQNSTLLSAADCTACKWYGQNFSMLFYKFQFIAKSEGSLPGLQDLTAQLMLVKSVHNFVPLYD